MTTAISIQNVSKAYRLGIIGHGTLREDLQSWWAKGCGKEDPNRIIGANGEGKSTLLKILLRVPAPTSLSYMLYSV